MAKSDQKHEKPSHLESKTTSTSTGTGATQKGGYVSKVQQPDLGATKPTHSGHSKPAQLTKAALTRLSIQQLPKDKPDFQTPGTTKDGLIAQWLTQWITTGLESGTLTENHLLPTKGDLSQYLGVSIGTVQNAIRFVEDEGHVESKQRIGTVIRNINDDVNRMRKQTSKREQAIVAIKQLIVSQGYAPGDPLPSAREMARLIGSAPNTTRLALEYLASQNIILSQGFRGNKTNWYVENLPDVSQDQAIDAIESETLIDHVERDLKNLINDSYSVNQKLPSHMELAEQFRVSIKTIHDAMKRLADQGIVHSKRGRYGTYVFRKPNSNALLPMDQDIFLPAQEANFYNYQRVEKHLIQLIRKQYQVGDKLPAMGQLADDLGVSSNTIRKALQNLSKSGIVKFNRGRYGGTFILKVPEALEDGPSFTWVSINPETIRSYRQSGEHSHS